MRWVLLAVILIACGKKGVDAKLDDLEHIRDALCACGDKACADAQWGAYDAWRKDSRNGAKPVQGQMKRFEDLRKQLQQCYGKLTPSAASDAATEGRATSLPK